MKRFKTVRRKQAVSSRRMAVVARVKRVAIPDDDKAPWLAGVRERSELETELRALRAPALSRMHDSYLQGARHALGWALRLTDQPITVVGVVPYALDDHVGAPPESFKGVLVPLGPVVETWPPSEAVTRLDRGMWGDVQCARAHVDPLAPCRCCGATHE